MMSDYVHSTLEACLNIRTTVVNSTTTLSVFISTWGKYYLLWWSDLFVSCEWKAVAHTAYTCTVYYKI